MLNNIKRLFEKDVLCFYMPLHNGECLGVTVRDYLGGEAESTWELLAWSQRMWPRRERVSLALVVRCKHDLKICFNVKSTDKRVM